MDVQVDGRPPRQAQGDRYPDLLDDGCILVERESDQFSITGMSERVISTRGHRRHRLEEFLTIGFPCTTHLQRDGFDRKAVSEAPPVGRTGSLLWLMGRPAVATRVPLQSYTSNVKRFSAAG